MGIKVTTGGVGHRHSFPKLMVSREHGYIILATSIRQPIPDEMIGTVVANPNGGPPYIGYYSSIWEPSRFDDYEGSITLINGD